MAVYVEEALTMLAVLQMVPVSLQLMKSSKTAVHAACNVYYQTGGMTSSSREIMKLIVRPTAAYVCKSLGGRIQ